MGATLKEAQQAAAHQAIEALVSACKVVLFKVLRYSNKRLFIIRMKIERKIIFQNVASRRMAYREKTADFFKPKPTNDA